MKLSEKMYEVLFYLREGKTTAFGYTIDCSRQYLNVNTVKSLIKRGMLEQCGEMPWHSEKDTALLYQISDAGKARLAGKRNGE